MQNEVVFSIGDLEHLVLTCANCKTQIAFDVKEGLPAGVPSHRNSMPEQCPVCIGTFDSSVQRGVNTILKTFKDLLENKTANQVVFRMKAPENSKAA